MINIFCGQCKSSIGCVIITAMCHKRYSYQNCNFIFIIRKQILLFNSNCVLYNYLSILYICTTPLTLLLANYITAMEWVKASFSTEIFTCPDHRSYLISNSIFLWVWNYSIFQIISTFSILSIFLTCYGILMVKNCSRILSE